MTDPKPDRPTQPAGKRAETIRRWWEALQPGAGKGDRAALARLRRAAAPLDAIDEPSLFVLYRRLGFGAQHAERRLPWVAVAAMTLAHVRSDDRHRSPARAVGRSDWSDTAGDTARMKPLRFQRLLAAREAEDVAREMRRLVELADRQIDVGALGAAILDWNDAERGDRVRTRWAFDYYAAADAAPDIDEAAETAPAPSDS